MPVLSPENRDQRSYQFLSEARAERPVRPQCRTALYIGIADGLPGVRADVPVLLLT